MKRGTLVGGLVAAGLLLGTAPAPAASPAWLAALDAQPCPVEYRVITPLTYTAEEQAAAKTGDFRVISDYVVHLAPPVDWRQDPFESFEFKSRLNDLQWLNILLYAYATNGDVDALEQARDLALDWVAKNPRGGKTTAPEAWDPKTAAKRISYLSYLIRAARCADVLSDPQASKLLDAIDDHGDWLKVNYSDANIGLMENFGLWQAGDLFPFISVSGWKATAISRTTQTVGQFMSSGVWLEHSPSYHLLALQLLERFDALIGGDPLYQEKIAKLRGSLPWFVEPDGRFVQFGHTDMTEAPDFALSTASGLEGLSPTRTAGYAIVRKNNHWLGVTDGFHNTKHKTADEMSIDLYDRGHRLLADTGRFSFDRVPQREFAESPKAHSTVVADFEGLYYGGAKPYGSGILATGRSPGGTMYGIQAENPLAKKFGITYRRVILYSPGSFLVVVDKLRSENKHVYTRLFHLGPDVDLSEQSGYLGLTAGAWAGRLYDGTAGESATRAQVRGQADPPRGFIYPSFRVEEPRWTVSYRSAKTRNADLVAAFSLDPAAPRSARLAPSSEGTKLELLLPNGQRSSTVKIVKSGTGLAIGVLPG